MKNKFTLTILSILFLLSGIDNASAQSCPNGDFESWNVLSYSTPDSAWNTSNAQSLSLEDSLTVWEVPGQSGHAIHIQTAIVGTDTLQAYITNSLGNPTAGVGGVPYSQQPTAITGYYRYNLQGNDSAALFVIFKKSGAIVSVDLFHIRNTSGSQSTFTAFSLPLTLATLPDSVIIGATSSNLFGSGLQSGSWLELDELAFTGTGITQGIPDGNFDTWIASSISTPASWYSSVDFISNGVSQVGNAYSGSYAVELTSSQSTDDHGNSMIRPAAITTAKLNQHGQNGDGLPYTHNTDTLMGYYQYTPAGTDSAWIAIQLSNSGNGIGGMSISLSAASSWTYFEMPFSSVSTPDSIAIFVTSSIQDQQGNPITTLPGSTLKLDYLQLKSQPLPTAVHNLNEEPVISIYPNPVTDVLQIMLKDPLQGTVVVCIHDIMGRLIQSKTYGPTATKISFDVSTLQAGMYFCTLQYKDKLIQKKFVKE